MDYRRLGKTEVRVSAIALGCWPIAGVTTLHAREEDSLATIEACFDLGINFLDTAYCYGKSGESENLIRRALGGRRDEMVVATKGGIHWGDDGTQVKDGRPETLSRQLDTSLKRLGTDYVDLLYLHAPDPRIPIEDSAGALSRLLRSGKTRAVGLSNANLDQLRRFYAVCPLTAFQPHFNMLQREIERELLPWCQSREIAVVVYWPLLKGLLAGKLPRSHVFEPGDGRAKYPMFQGLEWERNQDLLDRLKVIAEDAGRTISQLVIQWTVQRPGITSALCGAKRPGQIQENAGASDWRLSDAELALVDQALAERGPAASRGAV